MLKLILTKKEKKHLRIFQHQANHLTGLIKEDSRSEKRNTWKNILGEILIRTETLLKDKN